MTAAAVRSTKANRLAQYYLKQLRLANAAYKRGGESSTYGLQLFEQEWPQIRHWQAWAVSGIAGAGDPGMEQQGSQVEEVVALCSAFPRVGSELLGTRQNPRELLEWLEVALTAARKLGDSHAEAAHLTAIGRAYFALSSFDEAKAYAEQAMELAEALGNRALYAQNLGRLGHVAEMHGEFEIAKEFYERSLAINRSIGNKGEASVNLNRLGSVAYLRGENDTARNYFEQSLVICRGLGNEVNMASSLNNLGLVAAVLGDLTAARNYFEQSLAIMRRIGNKIAVGLLLNNLGVMARQQKDFASAFDYLQQSLVQQREVGHQDGVAFSLSNLGVTEHTQGNHGIARDYLEECVELLRTIGNQDFLAENLAKLTQPLVRLGELEAACKALREGLVIVRQINTDPSKEILIGAASMLWLARGNAEQAAQWLGLLFDRLAVGYDVREYLADYVLPDVKAALGAEKMAEAMEMGKTFELDDVIAQILDELNDERS
jgi:tetratricopeptide (TPR) repeat protein